MTRNAIRRLAVIAFTGTFIFAAVPAFACGGDNCTESNSPTVLKHNKKIRVVHHRHHRDDNDVASSDRRSSDADATRSQAKVETTSNTLPSDVADARAQMTGDEAKSKPTTEGLAQATVDAAAPTTQDPAVQVVNADELNDLDKAATEVTQTLPKLPPSVANSRAEMREDRPSTWAQTSTIGKAFIAFGVMLTLASAARMFMA